MILIKQVLLWQYSGALPKEEGFMYLLCPNNVQWHTVHKALFQLYLCIVSAFSSIYSCVTTRLAAHHSPVGGKKA